eukprot:11029329-Alexandrium_andersonii.AAC.1
MAFRIASAMARFATCAFISATWPRAGGIGWRTKTSRPKKVLENCRKRMGVDSNLEVAATNTARKCPKP